MHTQRVNISLPIDLVQRLKSQVPEGKRSQFIAKTLDLKLKKRVNLIKEFKKSLKLNKKFYEEVGAEIEDDFKYADAEVTSKYP